MLTFLKIIIIFIHVRIGSRMEEETDLFSRRLTISIIISKNLWSRFVTVEIGVVRICDRGCKSQPNDNNEQELNVSGTRSGPSYLADMSKENNESQIIR
jgi:hypothetical protein